MELSVRNGRGYVDSKENQKLIETPKVGEIAIDSKMRI